MNSILINWRLRSNCLNSFSNRKNKVLIAV
jgi:hypothetical protein